MNNFTKNELNRYRRQMILPSFGENGQDKIKNASVLVIGAGGLGCPVLQYLCSAGVGTLGIADFDTVELHNLNRQFLYNELHLGKPKAQVASEVLKLHNPDVNFMVFNEIFSKKNCNELIRGFDIIADCTDNFPARYLINDACLEEGKTLVYGSIMNFEGQFTVFNYNNNGYNLRDIFPEPPLPEETPGCNENGVIGVVPGIIGLYMANACIQIILGIFNQPECLLVFDLLKYNVTKFDAK